MNKILKFLIICGVVSFTLNPLANSEIRESRFAGHFYPADKESLIKTVDQYLATVVKTKIKGEVKAIIVPHAGYPFSARTAAAAYANINNKYKTVVLIGPSHRSYVKGSAVFTEGSFQTPLGAITVDKKLAQELLKADSLFKKNTSAHLNEHSLEVQLPFLQRKIKKGFKILPVLINEGSPEELNRIGEIIGKLLKGKKALIVISSDLSHYPRHKTAKLIDESSIFSLASMSPVYFLKTTEILLDKSISKVATIACGRAAIAVGMAAAKSLGADKFLKLKYEDSFDANPSQSSSSSVVGYLSGAFIKTGKKNKSFKLNLSKVEKTELLKFARYSILSELMREDPKFDLRDNSLFNQPAAIFVTLKEKGVLKGCIGGTTPRMTLYDAIFAFSKAAAFADHRFMPVKLKELKNIDIEISILSPLKEISSADEIIPNKHGVMLVNKNKSGLFLPQVWEQISKKEDFLNEICTQKAGLKKNCWLDKNTELYTFTVDSFKEVRK
jgi:MEMO1 family protein